MENAKNSPTLLQQELAHARDMISKQAETIAQLHDALERQRGLSAVKLNGELRVVSHQPELVDVNVEVPQPGSRVFGLTRGGVLIQPIWTKNQLGYIGATMAYPKVPQSVRDWLGHAWIGNSKTAHKNLGGT